MESWMGSSVEGVMFTLAVPARKELSPAPRGLTLARALLPASMISSSTMIGRSRMMQSGSMIRSGSGMLMVDDSFI